MGKKSFLQSCTESLKDLTKPASKKDVSGMKTIVSMSEDMKNQIANEKKEASKSTPKWKWG